MIVKTKRDIASLKNMTSLRINNKDFVAEEIGLQTSNAFVEFIRKKLAVRLRRVVFKRFFHPVYVREFFGAGFPLFSVSIPRLNLVGASSNSPALSVSHFASNNTSLVP